MTTKIGVCGYKIDKPVCCTYYHLKNGICRGPCELKLTVGKQTCKECTKGYFGGSCTPCQYPYYGDSCRFTCNCSQGLCHNEHGCQESAMQSTAQISEQSVQPTMRSTIATTETRHLMKERSSSMLTTTTKTWTAGSFSSTYLAMTSLEATRTSVSMGVPPDHTSQTSVIIIVGSLVCSFLIFILGFQIHIKFLKRKNVSKRKNVENLINLYEMEDIYNHIEDGRVSIVSDKYDVLANQSDAESLTSPYISPEFDKPNKNLSPTCSYMKTTKEGNICQSPTQSQDNIYIDPVAKLCTGFTDIVASPTRDEMQEETGEKNPKDVFQIVNSSLVNEEQNIQKDNYLDVVNQ